MRLSRIVLKLRLAETRFGNNIGGAANLAYALEGTLKPEMAFVIQISEAAAANKHDNEIEQELTEQFGVIVALRNDTSDKDRDGLTAYDSLYEIRAEIFRALLGWKIEGAESYPIAYSGGRVLGINKAQFWYQFTFMYKTWLGQENGVDVGRDDLDNFDKIYARWALIGPAGREYGEWADFNVPGAPPDMGSIVDFTEDPRDGAFGPGFGIRFDVSEH